jgi:Cys-rich repeat protein
MKPCTYILPAILGLFGCNGSGDNQTDGGGEVIPCSNRLDCPGKLGCVEGICDRCNRDRECLITEFCHPNDQLCHLLPDTGDECVRNADCDLGQFCVQGYCKNADELTPCTRDQDCPEGKRCDPLNKVCIVNPGCNRDLDCNEGEVCDLTDNRCMPACTPETQDQICGFGLFCDQDGHCVECYQNDQCALGFTCNTETHRCEGGTSCVTSRDCLAGEVCNPQTHQCTVVPLPCLSNQDCPGGTVCDPTLGQCVPHDCRADPFEPNDLPGKAAKLTAGRIDDLTLCPEDLDWFKLDLMRGDRLMVIVNTDFLASDHFHIVLFDPGASEVLREGNLLIDHTVAANATYLLRAQTSDPRATYGLVVTISRGIPCDDDDLEPNDTAYDATIIGAGHFAHRVICPHDEDWYVLERPQDKRLEVRIDYPAIQGDLDLDLVAGDAQTLVMRSATAGNSEFVFVDDNPGTRFFIRVYANPETANQYEMTVELQPRAKTRKGP